MGNEASGNPGRSGAIIIVAAALMAIGLVMVASTSVSPAASPTVPAFWRTPFGRQLVFVLAGFAVILFTSRAGVPILASPGVRLRLAQLLFLFSVACLIAAFIPGLGDAHRGSHRWLRMSLGGVTVGFQPSELAKLALVGLLASVLAEQDADPRSFRRCFLPAAIAIGLCVGLVGKADFGTSALLAAVGGAVLFVAGCRLRHLAVVATLGVCGLTALLFAAPYRWDRLKAFFGDYWSHPQGAGYQPVQSLTTIASGGWFGRGLGQGVQKYGYLPESHTDFIFAVICEETGVLGAGLVIILFCLLVWLGFRTMLAARSRFERLLAFGLTATIVFQAVMNIAVVTVVAPTKGISLPLVSAGGSGMIAFSLAIGALSAIAARAARDVALPSVAGTVPDGADGLLPGCEVPPC
jgi:cell division protein FtsW